VPPLRTFCSHRRAIDPQLLRASGEFLDQAPARARARQTGPAEAISTPTPTTELPTAPHLQHPCQTDTDQSSDIMADDKFYRVLGVPKVRRHRVGGPRPGGATKVVRGRSRARGRVFVIRLASKRRRLIATM
jgi:hypothetical protein